MKQTAKSVPEVHPLREWMFPEEDRHLYTTKPWDAGYRWFRSPNILCLEQYRPRRNPNNAPGK